MYKLIQIWAPQSGNAKNPPLNRPSKYKTAPPFPGSLYWDNCPQIQSKTTKTVNLLPTVRLAQSIWKREFPSEDKPLRIQAPPKISPLKRGFENCKPRGLFSEFYGIMESTQ